MNFKSNRVIVSYLFFAFLLMLPKPGFGQARPSGEKPAAAKTELVSVTLVAKKDIEGYDPAEDSDLYEYYLADVRNDL